MRKLFIHTCIFLIVPSIALSMETLVTPSLSVSTTYTDNVDRVSENPEDDFITSVTPSLALDLLSKTSNVNIVYAPSRVYYARTQDNDYWRHRVSLNAQSQLGRRVNATIGGSYLQSRDPADVEDVDLSVRRGSFEYETYTANADLEYQFGARDQIGLGFNYGRNQNEDPSLSDKEYYGPTLNFTYWFTNWWGTELEGRYERVKYDESESISLNDNLERFYGAARLLHQFNRRLQGNLQYAIDRVLYEGETEDERIHDISAGFDYQLDQDMGLLLQLGYSVVERPGLDNETGLSGDFSFTKTLRRGSIGLNASSGYDFDYYGATDLGFSYFVGGGVNGSYQIFRRLTADAYANYRYTEYQDLIPQRNDDRIVAGCNLSFELLRWLFAGVGYSYSTVESNYEVNDYVDNRVYISLTATPSQPY